MKIESIFEESIKKAVENVDESSIKNLSRLVNDLLVVEGEIGNTEERLRKLKDQQKQLSEQAIPDKLAELGVADLRLSDGSRISADPFYSARITAKNLGLAHDWLRERTR